MTINKSRFCNCISIRMLTLIILIAIFILQGCTNTSNSVIASTGTTIGVELSQSEATQSPTAVLGYKRAELAYVPTNRATIIEDTASENSTGKTVSVEKKGIPNVGNGAKDSANVLMELRYRGIFSMGEGSGIYQRLAVGDIAVKQPGAAFMFSKNDDGSLNRDVVKHIADAQSEIIIENNKIDKIIAYVTGGSDTINTDKLKELIVAAETLSPSVVTKSVSTQLHKVKKVTDLKMLLSDPLDAAIAPLYKSLPVGKQ